MELENLVKELSTPIIPVLDGILVVPLIGKFDEGRANELLETALQGIVDQKANILILDVTGINAMDDFVIGLIEKVTQAITLIGAVPIVVGISAELSLQLTEKSIYLNELKCFATLKHGVHYALAIEGLQLTSAEGQSLS
nr:STAS domain-containing protein [Bacillus ectoiniformans]